MPKKRMILIAIAGFIFAIVLFTVIFLTILQPHTTTGSSFPIQDGASPSSYAVLSYGDLSSIGLIVTMISAIIYFILKA